MPIVELDQHPHTGHTYPPVSMTKFFFRHPCTIGTKNSPLGIWCRSYDLTRMMRYWLVVVYFNSVQARVKVWTQLVSIPSNPGVMEDWGAHPRFWLSKMAQLFKSRRFQEDQQSRVSFYAVRNKWSLQPEPHPPYYWWRLCLIIELNVCEGMASRT